MKNSLLLLLLFFSGVLFSQIKIKGTVYELNGPLEGVAVYLNNSMLGTTTNKGGEFEISVKEGSYELIISYLGYKKINYALNTSKYTKPLVFTLEVERESLDEIIIKKTIYDDEWKYNLTIFKNEFIGKTKLSKECKILNPEVLRFDFDKQTGVLSAFAKKPLLIQNKSLGYLITYELESFIRSKRLITYLGYSRYKQLKGNKRKQKRWKKSRFKAYNGSIIHFYKSLLNNSFEKEGFIVNQFKRVSNPKRPSGKAIKKARELIRLHRETIVFNKSIKEPKTAIDSALFIVRKARLPEFADYMYAFKLNKKQIIGFKNNQYYFCFNDNLSILYTKEKEEISYINRSAFYKTRRPTFQTSAIIPINKKVILDKSGVLVNPLDVFYEGYWSYEKFANSLPLDYIPLE